MPVELRTLAYTSDVVDRLDTPAFMLLLKNAQRFNASVDVTGLLVISDYVKFVQTIEGTVEAVRKVYERVARDQTHTNIVVFVDESIKTRVYPDWAMMTPFESATPALLAFLRYAMEREPPVFTPGQLTALTKTIALMPVE